MTTLKEEEPYAAAVDDEMISLTCSKCFAWNLPNVERVKLSRCAGCKVLYYCSAKCQKADWKDHKPECKLLQSANFVPSKAARLVMRMIAKSKSQPDFKAYNGRTYDSLMHHSAERLERPNCMLEGWTIHSEIGRFMGSNAPDFDTVFLALSKKATNAFTIHDGTWACDSRGTGLYLGLSVLDHSCRPDAFVVNQGSKRILKTTKEGCVYSDKLTISYSSGKFFMDTNMRRGQLVNSYQFFCECEECMDTESNKKRSSGRPACCPNSWFYIPDRICNSCKKKVSFKLADRAEDAMDRLCKTVMDFVKREHEGDALMALVPEWMKLFDTYKEVLSDENTYLFAIANMIYITVPLTQCEIACKYADLCLPQARKRPHTLYSTVLLTRRQQFYEMLKKPLQEMKEALNEALDFVQVVFGPEHELTQSLLQKKMLYDLMNLKTR